MFKEFKSWMEVPLKARRAIENEINKQDKINDKKATLSQMQVQEIFNNGCLVVVFRNGRYEVVDIDHYDDEDYARISQELVEEIWIVNGKANSSSTRLGREGAYYEDVTLEEAEPVRGTVKRGMRGYRGHHRSATRGVQLLNKVLGDYIMDPRFRKRNS